MKAKKKSLVAVDTETTGGDLYHGCKPFMAAALKEDGSLTVWEWPVNPLTREPIIPRAEVKQLKQLIKTTRQVYHNTKFDWRALHTIGAINRDPVSYLLEDTLIASHCLDSHEAHGLKELGMQYLSILDDDQEELKEATKQARNIARGKGWRIAGPQDPHFPAQKRAPRNGWWVFDTWLPKAIAKADKYSKDHPWQSVCKTYCSYDVKRTLELWYLFQEALEAQGLLDQYQESKRLIPVTYRIEKVGLPVKTKKLGRLLCTCSKEQAFHEKAARLQLNPTAREGINLASSHQIGEAIDTLGLNITKRTPGGKPATDFFTLLDIRNSIKRKKSKAYKFLTHLLLSKKYSKSADYLSSYQLGLLGKRLHPAFNITGTKTSRFSSQNPNAQNIGKGEDPFLEDISEAGINLRESFGPFKGREWYLLDYSQLQLRIFAQVSEEKSLIKAFADGWDAHTFVASRIFKTEEPTKGQRRIAKNVNFGFIFGASPRKIEETARMPGLWDSVIKLFPHAHKFIKQISNQVRKRGFVTTSSGYKLVVPKDQPYKGVNYIVQGDEGIIVKRAMVACDCFLQGLARAEWIVTPDHSPIHMVLQVHDELIFDCPIGTDLNLIRSIKGLMEEAGESVGLIAPVEAEHCKSTWAKGEKVTFKKKAKKKK